MKRIESLVEKLNMQVAQKASLDQLLVTVLMLQKEITGSLKEIDVLGATGIAVIAPVVPKVLNLKEDTELQSNEKEYFELLVDPDEQEEQETPSATDIPSYEEMEKLMQQTQQADIKNKEKTEANIVIDSMPEELPTLSRQPKATTRAARQAPRASRNAIKDLKKAINAQDRLRYVKELFRGDENMFDRSIQTINNFNTLGEAEYWIMRELKTKNGWLPANPTVQQFEQLIKRRFS